MRQESSFFDGQEPALLYIAKNLRDAKALEELLTLQNIEYGVETDEYEGGVVFRSLRTGAFFYVLPEVRAQVAEMIKAKGYAPSRVE